MQPQLKAKKIFCSNMFKIISRLSPYCYIILFCFVFFVNRISRRFQKCPYLNETTKSGHAAVISNKSSECDRRRSRRSRMKHFRKPLWRKPDAGNCAMRSRRRFLTSDSLCLDNSIGSHVGSVSKVSVGSPRINFQEPPLHSGLRYSPQCKLFMTCPHNSGPQTSTHRRSVTQPQCATTSSDATNLLSNRGFSLRCPFFSKPLNQIAIYRHSASTRKGEMCNCLWTQITEISQSRGSSLTYLVM